MNEDKKSPKVCSWSNWCMYAACMMYSHVLLFEFCDVMLLFSVHSARIDGRRKRDQLGKSI